MRVGIVVKVIPLKKIGFIRTDDFREDVFFHFSKVDLQGRRELLEGDEVEYEIDELARIDRKELRATLVRMSSRPLTMTLKTSDAPELHAHHHPKARRKRPVWRKGNRAVDEGASAEGGETQAAENDSTHDAPPTSSGEE